MEYRSKSQVLGNAKSMIKMYNEFLEVLEILKTNDLVKSYDGKQLTKRFTDKVQTILPEHIKISLESESYSEYLNITLYYDNNVKSDADIRKYITSYETKKIEIGQERPNSYNKQVEGRYCINGVRTFNYEVFIKRLEKRADALKHWIDEYEQVIEHLDYVVQKTKELQKLVEDTIRDFPHTIRPYVKWDYVVQDDK